MKRIITALLIACILLSAFPAAAHAELDPESISTPFIVLMDADSGTVLYEKKAHERAFPASTTKIMTAILAIERGNLDDVVTVGGSVESRGSQMKIRAGEKLTLKDLLHGMMLLSGNDAARAIAEHIAGSEAAFAVLMNQKAAELGMTGTNFVKSNGLHKDDHYSTAYDMALLTQYAMKNEAFRTLVKTGKYEIKPTNKNSHGYILENTNKLLYTKEGNESFEYRYATGVKTGDTDQAGRCLIASAQKDGVNLILVLFGDYSYKVSSPDYRFKNAAEFFKWGFDNYTSVTPEELGLNAALQKSVTNCSFEDPEKGNLLVNLDFGDKKVHGLKSYIEELKQNLSAITCAETLDRSLAAPIKAGEVLGTVAFQYNGKTLLSASMVSTRDVAELGQSTGDNNGPSPSPFLISNSGGEGNKQSSLWFWLLLLFLLLLGFTVFRVFAIRKARKRNARRRRAYRAYRR